VFGSSAAEGVPDFSVSFWRCLYAMLQTRYPQTNVEIYSAAMSGANSHIMRAAARACAKCQPDLFVVYMGNNERNGLIVQKLAAKWEPWALGLPFVHANVFLSDLRLAQLVPQRMATVEEEAERYHHLAYTLEEEKVYRYFDANLRDICADGVQVGAQVLLCTVGTRLREWMVSSVHHRMLSPETQAEWDTHFRDGTTAEEAHDLNGAIGQYIEAAKRDDSYAELSYRMANCYWALEDYEKARTYFALAKEQDGAHCRANDRINDVIRKTALAYKGRSVLLVDAERALADDSPHRIPGPELFLDFAHMTIDGNYVLARAVLEGLTTVLPGWMTSQAGGNPAVLSMEECKRYLGFSLEQERDIIRRVLRPNEVLYHQSQANLIQRLAELDSQIGESAASIVMDAYRTALQLNGRDTEIRERYARRLFDKGDAAGAIEQLAASLAIRPYSYAGMTCMTQALERNGDNEGALRQADRLLAIYPGWWALTMRGGILARMQRFEDAVSMYRKALKIAPLAGVKQSLGGILMQMGRLDEAIQTFREATAIDAAKPGSTDPTIWTRHADLARALMQKKDYPGAVASFCGALESNPNEQRVRSELVGALSKIENPVSATRELERCRKLGIELPTNLEVRPESRNQGYDASRKRQYSFVFGLSVSQPPGKGRFLAAFLVGRGTESGLH